MEWGWKQIAVGIRGDGMEVLWVWGDRIKTGRGRVGTDTKSAGTGLYGCNFCFIARLYFQYAKLPQHFDIKYNAIKILLRSVILMQ